VKRRTDGHTPGPETTRPASGRSHTGQPRNFVLDALEPRILLSADPITQALSHGLVEHSYEAPSALIEIVDWTTTHLSEPVGGAASRQGRPADADWTIDLGDGSQANEGGDWLFSEETNAHDMDARSPIAQVDSSGSGSSRSDRSADLGEAAGGDEQKVVHRVVVEPTVDTLREFENQSFAEPGILASRMVFDDSLVRAPPASDCSIAEEDHEGPYSGAIPEAGLVLLQEAAIPAVTSSSRAKAGEWR